MKKLAILGAGAFAAASLVLSHPVVAVADPVSANSLNVTGLTYDKARASLQSQGIKAYFGGSIGSDLPQKACIVENQRQNGGHMYLMLDCTQKAADNATDSQPATAAAPGAAPGAPAPRAGQGTYGAPIGVPVPVG